MIIGYARVSTRKQAEGFGLDAQKDEILNRYENIEIVEEQYSGTTTDRPKLQKLLENLKEGDTLGGILKNVSMSFEELAKVNRILYNLIVPAGTILLIPGKKEEK